MHGKPFYIAGPDDNVRRIVALLTRAVGEGNFDFVAPLPADDALAPLEDDEDDAPAIESPARRHRSIWRLPLFGRNRV